MREQEDIRQIAKEMTEFCQRQVIDITTSPLKRAIVIAVITAIITPAGNPGPGDGDWWKHK